MLRTRPRATILQVVLDTGEVRPFLPGMFPSAAVWSEGAARPRPSAFSAMTDDLAMLSDASDLTDDGVADDADFVDPGEVDDETTLAEEELTTASGADGGAEAAAKGEFIVLFVCTADLLCESCSQFDSLPLTSVYLFIFDSLPLFTYLPL